MSLCVMVYEEAFEVYGIDICHKAIHIHFQKCSVGTYGSKCWSISSFTPCNLRWGFPLNVMLVIIVDELSVIIITQTRPG